MSYIANKRLNLVILTNGTLINEENITLFNHENIQLNISLDGHNAEVHDMLRGKGQFSKTMKAINLLNETKAQFIFSYTLHKQNYRHIEDFLKLAISLNVKSVGFVKIDLIGRAKINMYLKLSLNDREEIKQTIQRLQNKYKGYIDIQYLDSTTAIYRKEIENCNMVYCVAGTNRIAIDSRGLLFPCTHAFVHEELIIGDLKDNSIIDLWTANEKWELYRGGIKLKEIVGCSDCKLRKMCSLKNCRIKSYNNDIKLYGKPADCLLDVNLY